MTIAPIPPLRCTLLLVLAAALVALPAAEDKKRKRERPPLGIPAFADPAEEGIAPALPNVLIIGDSISIGYTPFVADLLAGKANVFHCGGRWNCNATNTGLALGRIKKTDERYIDAWCGFQNVKAHPLVVHPGYPKMAIHHPTIDYSAYDLEWDVITCNWGMWDIIRGGKPGAKPEELARMEPKDPSVPLPTYRERLRESFTALAGTGARVLWVATTPVDEGVPNVRLRREEDVVAYNAAAAEEAERMGVGVVDLHGAVKPRIVPEWRRSGKLGDVHFSEPANRFLAERLVEAITAAIAQGRREADSAEGE